MQQAESGRLHVVALGDQREDAADVQVDDSAGLPSPGRYVHEQRKRRGISVEQLASATKIPRSSLLMLEDDRYEELPAPLSVKATLRGAAPALELDPDNVMELLYERERALLQARRRDKPSAPALEQRPADHPNPAEPESVGLANLLARASSVSLVLWVIVALMVAMVMMAALSIFGPTTAGPT